MLLRKVFFAAMMFYFPPAAAAATEARYDPLLMEAAAPSAHRHAVEVGADFLLDGFKTEDASGTLKGLFTRGRPRLEYRYAPSRNVEVFFIGRYTAQNVVFRAADDSQVASGYSAGLSAPTVGFKLALGRRAALSLFDAPATAATRSPALGDGAHHGARLLFRSGAFHFSAGHVVRLPYFTHGSSWTFRRDAGDVTELSVAMTKRNRRDYDKDDTVGPVAELHGSRLDGRAVRGSAGFSGRAVFGFALGRLKKDALHLTKVALAAGFGRTLHKTDDPLFGVGDVQLSVAYACHWSRRQ
jgi:hypothetical protein